MAARSRALPSKYASSAPPPPAPARSGAARPGHQKKKKIAYTFLLSLSAISSLFVCLFHFFSPIYINYGIGFVFTLFSLLLLLICLFLNLKIKNVRILIAISIIFLISVIVIAVIYANEFEYPMMPAILVSLLSASYIFHTWYTLEPQKG